MIPPRQQWAIQIEATNACTRRCANCTRLVPHVREPYFMDLDTFTRAVDALADFPTQSDPDGIGRDWVNRDGKIIGIMGGEPLLHPRFADLVGIMANRIPKQNRGLWTGLPLTGHRHERLIHESFRYINHNLHDLVTMVHLLARLLLGR